VSTVTAALYQGPERSEDVADNLAALDRAAAQAAARGAHLLISPEMSATGYNIGARIGQLAQPADGPLFDAVAATALRHGVAIAYGYPEMADGAVYNSVTVVGGDGRRLANYRKTHLFGSLDKDNFRPGERLVTQFDFAGLRCGLLTCYDVEFPEAVRAHADAGTQWLIVPTGLMRPYEHVATRLVPARAYESQLYLTYVNRCGVEDELQYCGLSCAIAPDGAELARAGAHEELLFATIDPAALVASRAVNTHLSDRRLDLY
jgi:predicted amidohydrolase